MRELTQAQRDFLVSINTPEYREEARKNQEAHDAAMAAAKAERDRLWAIQDDQNRRAKLAREASVRPLKEALKAAGIKLEFDGYYDGAWLRYQIGNGPVVEVEEGLDAFDDDED
jgi:hypothetical protein